MKSIPAIHIHPRLRGFNRYHVAVTAVLLTLLIAPQFLDAFAAERAVISIRHGRWGPDNVDSLPVVTASLVIVLLLLAPGVPLFRFLTRFGPPPTRVETTAVLRNLSLMRASKGIDRRLWAAGFLPAGSDPDPASPRIVALRPARLWKFDNFNLPPLRIEVALEEHADRIEVRALAEPNKLFARLSIDTGEGDYTRALLEHVVTGDPMRTIGDQGIGAFFSLISAWILSLLVIGCQFGWMSSGGGPLQAAAFFPAAMLPFALLERSFRPNIVGADLSCAVSLLLVCGAILIRAAPG